MNVAAQDTINVKKGRRSVPIKDKRRADCLSDNFDSLQVLLKVQHDLALPFLLVFEDHLVSLFLQPSILQGCNDSDQERKAISI